MAVVSKPWKVEVQRDRRSNMATSSIKAPAKKAGAGGRYTWGSPMEMDVTDYEPIGLGGLAKVSTMASAPRQAMKQPAQQAPVAMPLQDAQQFPTPHASIGTARPVTAQSTSIRWGRAPAVCATAAGQPAQADTNGSAGVLQQPAGRAVSAPATAIAAGTNGPSTANTPKVILGEDMLRASVPAIDSQHPRHTFARKPHKPANQALELQVQEGPSIDWTQAGTTSFQRQVIHAVNPAHLGPHVVALQQGPSLAMLKALPAGAYIPNQKLMKRIISGPRFGKPLVIFKRKC